MTPYLFTVHLLNLLAPAVLLSLVMAWGAPRLPGWRGVRPWVATSRGRFVWGLALNLLVLGISLLLGSPGKMQVYAAMLLVSAVAHFFMLRGWKR